MPLTQRDIRTFFSSSYCAFEADADNAIDVDDVTRGAWEEHGAFEQLGTKFFEGLYFDQMNSEEYREVLRFMADHLDDWVTKDEIKSGVTLKPSTLNNALTALKKRRLILSQPRQQGTYTRT